MPKHSSLALCFKDIDKNLADAEILLVCEPNLSWSDKDSWRWSLPGGKCCRNLQTPCCAETPNQTVIRECLEETGYRVTPVQIVFADNLRNSETDEKYKRYSFLVIIQDGQPLRKKVFSEETPKWFPLRQLPRNLFFSHRQIIEKFAIDLSLRGLTGTASPGKCRR